MRRDRSGRSRPVTGEPSNRATRPDGRNSVDRSVTSASPAASDARPPKPLDLENIALQQAAGRAWLIDHYAVSRETLARLDAYVAMLTDWQTRMNLVAPSTLGDVWRRHVADSLSLERLLPEFSQAVDLGSGGGLPALVIAACRPESAVDMVESSRKKAAFLAAARTEMGVMGTVHPVRIETAGQVLGRAEVVTARALASLDDLLAMVAPHISRETRCFFQKGRSHEQEIAAATANWRFTMIIHESQVEADSVILEVAAIARRQG
ncbi:16S rRNA (guanine(527)-N(7))-methyltransferase RsmG [Jiella pacifica]|uniref:Ribosomal RNA small subunit methyltransferase G n=1 Tax=Jiella pacifica TaxID=2696469 RepID=A0A6N9T4B8_9HYPH|nr:16S rRNA (guanine(527)-N(7))-methyltransferase RsmG [Jiella pacifica]NDW06217.1 16S rRNA (guanine(527)-N(7))-methyltransferase RsmG [Jiella pacifica]